LFTDPLTNPAYVIFAALIPILVALFKQQGLSPTYNSLIAVIIYIVVGVIGALVSGYAFTLENVVAMIMVGAAVGNAAYTLFWSQIAGNMELRVMMATSLIKPKPDAFYTDAISRSRSRVK